MTDYEYLCELDQIARDLMLFHVTETGKTPTRIHVPAHKLEQLCYARGGHRMVDQMRRGKVQFYNMKALPADGEYWAVS